MKGSRERGTGFQAQGVAARRGIQRLLQIVSGLDESRFSRSWSIGEGTPQVDLRQFSRPIKLLSGYLALRREDNGKE